jgi:phage gpG-like protein
MISMQIIGAERVVNLLGAAPAKIEAAAKSSLDVWAAQLAAYIKSDKLSGNPLHRRSGALSASVHPVTSQGGDTVSGGAGGGAGIPYAKIHEFGGTIAHPGGTAYFIGQDGMATFVSNASALADRLPRTKPHSIPIPERSYMRSAFEERAPSGIERLRAAVQAAIAA